MKKNLIDHFFTTLDRGLQKPAEIILTGAAAGALMGNIRPSVDIDFEIRVKGWKKSKETSLIQQVIQEVSSKTGIRVNYSEDIGRWSMINYLNYRRSAIPYKMVGKLQIKLMAPEYWTIGKMARFLEIDIQDLLKIIKKRKLKAEPLIQLWGRALRLSPLSLALGRFRDHVVYFLGHYGKSIWGKSFNLDRAITLFKRSAGLSS